MRDFRLLRFTLLLSFAVLTAGLLTGCPARTDLTVGWTIGGVAASDGCEGVGDTVSILVVNRDDLNSPTTNETFTAACADGSAVIQVGNTAELVVSLLNGSTEVGASSPRAVEIGTYAGTENPALDVDVSVHTGRLEATLNVAGQSCGDAGASSFEVTLRRALFSLDVTDVETATVSCDGGEATYVNTAVAVGTRHYVYARTTAGGKTFVTSTQGTGVNITGANNTVIVNLRDEARPPVPDAGQNNIGNPPPFDGGNPPEVDAGTPAVDAGTTDAGTPEVDAGTPEVDAGIDAGTPEVDAGTPEVDAGTPEVDAGTTDAGTPAVDAGTTDAGTATDGGVTDAG